MDRQRVILVDIDGTVADHTGIRDHYDWDRVHLDVPKNDVIYHLESLVAGSGAFVVFVTGRMAQCREATSAWLYEHVLYPWAELNLVMRPDGDESTGPDFKERIYREVIEPRWEVILVLEDRPDCVAMWRQLALTCFQVDAGDQD